MARLMRIILMILTLILFTTLEASIQLPHPNSNDSLFAFGILPAHSIEYRPVSGMGNRRSLAPFQLCLLCRCCTADDPSNCSSMPCCFGIDCNIPDKPYGVCAFVPNSCNCTSCA